MEHTETATFRLFDVNTERLEPFAIDDHPAFIAASHTWSDNVFQDGPFQDCFGGKAVMATIRDRYPEVHHCWFDTKCIDQDDPNDKLTQIPLMDRIYGQATCVLICLSNHIKLEQTEVDQVIAELDGALAMCQAAAWAEEGAHWQGVEGRATLMRGMKMILRLASTSWATRIWTLQEFILAKETLWIGFDLVPIKVDSYALTALPDICNTLSIEECLIPRFGVLQGFFAGMANVHLGLIDRTRVMELTGNRTATVPVDEVYGVMAASGVAIEPIQGETQTDAWTRWCEVAICKGHLRWCLLPASSDPPLPGEMRSCIFPSFTQRHKLSGTSGLDTINPLGRTRAVNGTLHARARYVGSVGIVRRLGRVHEAQPGRIDRDITIILFSEGQWSLALQLAAIFGGIRQSSPPARAIAQVLVQSYEVTLRCVASGHETNFRPVIRTTYQQRVWNDFMALQQYHMLGLNEGVGYLCRIGQPRQHAIVVVGQSPPAGPLLALDFRAKTPDGRTVLMVVQAPTLVSQDDNITLHKVGMTLPLRYISKTVADFPMTRKLRIGGFNCSSCLSSQPKASIEDERLAVVSRVRRALQVRARFRRPRPNNTVYTLRSSREL